MLLSWMGMLNLAQAEEVDSVPEVWVQCNPISGLMELEQLLPESYRESTKGLGEIGVEGFEKLGGDPNGILMAAGSDGLTMKIPFTGEAGSVSELLGVLQTDAIVWQTGPAAWSLELLDDHWVVTLKDGYLEMSSIATSSIVEPPSVLSTIPDVEIMEGCWVMISSDLSIPKTKVPLDGGLFFPFADDPFSLFMKFEQELPNFLTQTGATPLTVQTPNAPAIVMSLGFDWAELFADPVVLENLNLGEQEAQKISKRLRIQPGGLIAFENINVRKDPKISVALELHNRFGKPQSEWLIKRGIMRSLKQSGLAYDKLDSNIVSFVNNGQVLYIGFSRGRLFAGNTKSSIENMIQNEGEAWTDEGFNSFAQEQPIAMRIVIPQMVGMMAGGVQGVDLGLRKLDEYAQVTLHVNTSNNSGLMGLLPFIAGQLPEANPSEPISDGARIVQQLAAKEHMVRSETGSYVEVGQTGVFDNPDITIPGDILDLAPVTSSASAMGWIQQPQNGVYWVEIIESGFLVHGIFPFQGRLVHYTKDQLGQITLVDLPL